MTWPTLRINLLKQVFLQSLPIAPRKGFQERLRFWIPTLDSGFSGRETWIPDSNP